MGVRCRVGPWGLRWGGFEDDVAGGQNADLVDGQEQEAGMLTAPSTRAQAVVGFDQREAFFPVGKAWDVSTPRRHSDDSECCSPTLWVEGRAMYGVAGAWEAECFPWRGRGRRSVSLGGGLFGFVSCRPQNEGKK